MRTSGRSCSPSVGSLPWPRAVGIGRFIYTPILPPMAEGLHLTKGEAGLIASANFLGYLAGAVAAASPRFSSSPRAWLLAALATSAATTAAMAWAYGLTAFLALRFLGGMASAFALVFASALVLERLAAAGRANLSALHFSGVGTGIVASALLIWATDGCGRRLARNVARWRRSLGGRAPRSDGAYSGLRDARGPRRPRQPRKKAIRACDGLLSPMACSASAT